MVMVSPTEYVSSKSSGSSATSEVIIGGCCDKINSPKSPDNAGDVAEDGTDVASSESIEVIPVGVIVVTPIRVSPVLPSALLTRSRVSSHGLTASVVPVMSAKVHHINSILGLVDAPFYHLVLSDLLCLKLTVRLTSYVILG